MSWGQEIFRTKYRETMESLNTISENYRDLDTQYQEEMKEKDDEIERLNKLKERYQLEKEVFKDKIDKAIEYIEKNSDDMHTYISQILTDILKGIDKE